MYEPRRPIDHRAGESASHELLVFFPPEPPPLGAPAPEARPLIEREPAPAELAEFVGEPFYAPLSTRLQRRNLTARELHALDQYRAGRDVLVRQLREHLASEQTLEAPERERARKTFAERQSTPLAALEATAEKLRTGLLHDGLVAKFQGSGDWNENRSWRLAQLGPASLRTESLTLEFLVMRAAAFYQDGLSPRQRELLREIASELQVQAFRPDRPAVGAGALAEPAPAFTYFSPYFARVSFPARLAPSLAEQITAYRMEKNAIKSELREAVYRLDTTTEKRRRAALERLAAAQAPRLAALEEMADAIRAALAESAADDPAFGYIHAPGAEADYRAAALLPGLSTAQRRLLFAAAQRAMALPLPEGERIP